jgi:hypothetical protein
MSSVKQMNDAIATITSRLDALNTRFTALDAEIAAIKKLASKSASEGEVKVKKERKKSAKASKSEADTEADEPKEKDKVKREVKPSAARDAWRSLCDAVRAVHKKDAMRIAKILKEQGHMTPTAEQIEAAIAESSAKVNVTVTDGEGSDTATSASAKKRVRAKKEKVVSE